MTKYLFTKWTEEENCWWLVRDYYAEELGVILPQYAWERDIKKRSNFLKETCTESCWVELLKPEPNCIVVMGRGEVVHHAGIYLGANKVLHLPEKSNGRVESILELGKRNNIIKFYIYEQ